MSAFVVSMSNLKGGVGKSSTTFHLAGTLAKGGHSVLIIDADPQGSVTQAFIGPDETRGLDRRSTIASLFGGLGSDGGDLVRGTDFEGVWLLPGSPHLASYNVPDPHRCPRDDQRAIAAFTRSPGVAGRFDFVLIDTAPTLSLCTWAAMTASHGVVVPLQCEDFGSQGIAYVLDAIEAIQEKANPDLRLLGFLLTMYNPRLAIHQAYEATLRATYGDEVFRTMIPIATDYKEAVSLRRPVAFHKPRGAASKAIKAFSDELAERVRYTVQQEAA